MAYIFQENIFWLILINIILGIATLVLIGIIGIRLFKEIRFKLRIRKTAGVDLKELGVTMYDGGEKLDEQRRLTKSPGTTDPSDPPPKKG